MFSSYCNVGSSDAHHDDYLLFVKLARDIPIEIPCHNYGSKYIEKNDLILHIS